MLKFLRPFVALPLLGAACAAQSNPSLTTLQSTSAPDPICKVIEAPEAFANARVSVIGEIVTDYRDFTGIRSENCSRRLLPLRFSNNSKVSCADLHDAVGNVVRPQSGRVSVHIEGKVELRGGQPVLFAMTCSHVSVTPRS